MALPRTEPENAEVAGGRLRETHTGRIGRVVRIESLVYVAVAGSHGKTEIIGALPRDVKKIKHPTNT